MPKADPGLFNSAAGENDRFITAEIESLRRRLLDLTLRNPLLNYKHTGRSQRLVRLIDELPDQLFERLESERQLRFQSLGAPTDDPVDERSIQFRRALDAMKLQDPEYLQELDSLGEDPGQRLLDQAEDRLRIRLRERLGMPARKERGVRTAEDVAKERGLHPSYDLPSSLGGSSDAVEGKHADSAMQTLLFDDPLERALGGIRNSVRLSIDESGVNPLFLVFGFLEWYEDPNSSVPLHAPILLYPVELERELRAGRYQYSIKSTGEGLAINVALAEKLKHNFNITLPPLEDEETPEKYLAGVQRLAESHRGWKVRRWITAGLFSFARIAMYRDLGPENWEAQGGLARHRRLSRLLGGEQTTGDGPTETIDHPRERDELLLDLIADADSSQVGAIQDVLGGRDLVVEGPPGTGKSQTITNLIAALIASGKTVLFVAEKMAALSVVRDRLAHAGLEPFCLELHSTKAGRKEVVHALARRRQMDCGRSVAADLSSAQRAIKNERDHLEACVEALGRPAGSLGMTAQEVFWRCHAVRAMTDQAPSDIDELTLPEADRLTNDDIGRICANADQLERTRRAIDAQYGSVELHPWRGIASADMDPFRAGDIVRRMTRLAEALAKTLEVARRWSSTVGGDAGTIASVRPLTTLRTISDPQPEVEEALLSRMSWPATQSAMARFAQDADECSMIQRRLAPVFPGKAMEDLDAKQVQEFVQTVAAAGLAETAVQQLAAAAAQRSNMSNGWTAVADLSTKIAEALGINTALPGAETAMILAVELAASATPSMLAARHSELLHPGASEAMHAADQRADSLRHRWNAQNALYSVNRQDDCAQLRAHARALRSAPLLPFLSPRWWKARAAFKGRMRAPAPMPTGAMAAALDDLAQLVEDIRAFESDPMILNRMGARFRGLETDLRTPLEVARWADKVRAALSGVGPAPADLRSRLLDGPPEDVERMGAFAREPGFTDLRKLAHAEGIQRRSAAEHAAAARHRAEAATRAAQLASTLGLSSDATGERLQDAPRQIERWRALKDELDRSDAARELLGSRFQGHRTPTAPIRAACAYAAALNAADLPADARRWLLQQEPRRRAQALRDIGELAGAALDELDHAVADAERTAAIDWRTWIRSTTADEADVADLHAHVLRCSQDPDGLHLLIDAARSEAEMRREGFGPLLDMLRQPGALRALPDLCRRVIYQGIARAIVAASPALAGFTGDRHEGRRKQFKELDRRLMRLRQQAIRFELSKRSLEPGNGAGPRSQWTGLALIDNEIAKQKRHIPIRGMIERAGATIQQMTPCFMMSPLSIAQYLKPGSVEFDVVIMDEASQVRPEDAVGAIARSAQMVIVGDPKQLPPTSFFMGGAAPEGDGDGAADEQSILDAALTVLRPARRLKWHYRSRHASLIQFSNKEFYDSELVLFPSPLGAHPEFGVQYEHIPDGRYESSLNPVEAQRVAAATVEYALRHPDRSLGVVTMNKAQAELLLLKMDQLAAETPAFEAWRKRREATLEPFFVKNLENVQGDERDAIFISTVYGRSHDGPLHQRFGPVNQEGGHRRLNVLFSRAKCQMVVFSSMEPGEIRADEGSAWGVRALKNFLQFARDGRLEMSLPTSRPPDSDFEIAVARVLRDAGFDAVPQVGVAGYFIDLAVRHPDRPGEFSLGIECDGATYHSSKSARDRDRLRQEVLERLNWRLHRIWSLDWYRNQNREQARLLQAVRESIAGSAAPRPSGPGATAG